MFKASFMQTTYVRSRRYITHGLTSKLQEALFFAHLVLREFSNNLISYLILILLHYVIFERSRCILSTLKEFLIYRIST